MPILLAFLEMGLLSASALGSVNSAVYLQGEENKSTELGNLDHLPPNLDTTLKRLVINQMPWGEWEKTWGTIEGGSIDNAIAFFEKRAKESPNNPETQFQLGYAYFQKVQNIRDDSETSIYSPSGKNIIKANDCFDKTLRLDERHWGARFSKSQVLSFWPEHYHRKSEVVEHLEILVKQQEALPPRPEFSQTYRLLGNTYAELVRLKSAESTWEKGKIVAEKTPTSEHDALKKLLNEYESLVKERLAELEKQRNAQVSKVLDMANELAREFKEFSEEKLRLGATASTPESERENESVTKCIEFLPSLREEQKGEIAALSAFLFDLGMSKVFSKDLHEREIAFFLIPDAEKRRMIPRISTLIDELRERPTKALDLRSEKLTTIENLINEGFATIKDHRAKQAAHEEELFKDLFSETEYAPYARSGTGSISGQVFMKTEGGDVKYGAGNEVILQPVTTYSTKAFTKPHPGVSKYIHTTVANAEGRFLFEKLPSGEYFLTCWITWKYPSLSGLKTTGGWAVAKVKIGDGEQLINVVATG